MSLQTNSRILQISVRILNLVRRFGIRSLEYFLDDFMIFFIHMVDIESTLFLLEEIGRLGFEGAADRLPNFKYLAPLLKIQITSDTFLLLPSFYSVYVENPIN